MRYSRPAGRRPALSSLLALAALVAAALGAGCSTVLDLSDYTFYVETTGGAAGAAGAGGEAGAGGDAGTGGTAGAAGAGVSCGSPPPAVPAEVISACVYTLGCSPYPFTTLSGCIERNQLSAFSGLGCLRTASSCKDVQLCTHEQIVAPPDSCQGVDGWMCEPGQDGAPSTIARFCGTPLSWEVDCDGLGGTCELPGKALSADQLPCKVLDSCPGGKAQGCQNSTLFACIDGKGYGQHCQGSTCDDNGGTKAPVCRFNTNTCKVAGLASCTDDNHLNVCTSDKFAASFSCASTGLECKTNNADTIACLAPGCGFNDVKSCQESCDGTRINLCIGGASMTVNCADYDGMAACRQFDQGGFQGALCTPF